MEELAQLQHESHSAYVDRYRARLLELRAEADAAARACRDANNAWFRACRDGAESATLTALARTRGEACRAAGVARGLVDIHTARYLSLASRGG